jgi:beta-galactosidase
MGNGPGWLEDYQELFRTYPRLQGGFIWEWANHGLWKEDSDGKSYYAYGGDFGDFPNDGTFVMDGLLFSAHKPTPGLLELKKVIEPVKVSMDGENLKVSNLYDFVGLEHLTAAYKIEELGEEYVVISPVVLRCSTDPRKIHSPRIRNARAAGNRSRFWRYHPGPRRRNDH